MTARQLLCIVLLVAVGVMAVQPAPAEALEPTLMILLITTGVALVAIIGVLLIGAAHERQYRSAGLTAPEEPVLVAVAWQGEEAP